MGYVSQPVLKFRKQVSGAKAKEHKNIPMLSRTQEKYSPRSSIKELGSKIIIFVFSQDFKMSLEI